MDIGYNLSGYTFRASIKLKNPYLKNNEGIIAKS